MSGLSIAEKMDQIRDAFDLGRVGRDEAVRQIRALADITEIGADDLLTDPERPSARYRSGRAVQS